MLVHKSVKVQEEQNGCMQSFSRVQGAGDGVGRGEGSAEISKKLSAVRGDE